MFVKVELVLFDVNNRKEAVEKIKTLLNENGVSYWIDNSKELSKA